MANFRTPNCARGVYMLVHILENAPYLTLKGLSAESLDLGTGQGMRHLYKIF